MFLRPALRAALVLAANLALALQPTAVDAVTLTWAQVNGTWDITSLNWTGTSGSTTWPAVSSGTDTAIFGSSGGTVTLSGTIIANALNFNANGYTITGGTSLQLDGATPTITTASGLTATINSAISGTTGFNKTGAGTLIVGGASTETGPVSINQGALQLNPGASFVNSSSVTVQNATLTLNDVASGAGGLTYTFPLHNLVLNNATVSNIGLGNGDAGMVFNNLVTLAGTSSIMVTKGNFQRVLYFNGGISGSGSASLIVQGNNPAIVIEGDDSGFSGTLTVPSITTGNVSIQSAHAWGVGATLIVAGKVSVNTGSGIVPGSFRYGQNVVATDVNEPTSLLVINTGGTFNTAVNITVGSLNGTGGIITMPSGKRLTVGALSTTDSYAGVIAGVGGFSKVGSGTMILRGSNTYAGSTIISGGVLSTPLLANGAAPSGIGASTNAAVNLVLDGATLQYTGTGASTDRQFTLTTKGGIIDASGSGALSFTNTAPIVFTGTGSRSLTLTGSNTATNTLAAVLGDNGGPSSLIKAGLGTWVLTGTNTYTGSTAVNGGTLQISADNNLGAPTGALSFNGGTLATTNSFTTGRTTTLNLGGGIIDVASGTVLTMSSAIGGGGALTKTDTGTLVLTATNTYTGGTFLNSGTIAVGNGGTSGSLTGNVTDNATLLFNRSDTLTFAGIITGSGVVNQIGTGTTILTGNSSYTGGTTISTGTLQLGNGGTSGSITGNVTDNTTLLFNRSDTLTFTGAITGPGVVNQIGTGTTVLTTNSAYTGGTTISAGTLQLGNGGTSGSIVGDVTDNGTLAFNRSDVVVFPGVISGSGSVNQTGTGTTILTDTNTYTGGTTISAGTLQLGNGGTSGSIVGSVTDNGTLAFNRSDTVTFPGLISGTGSVNQVGPGTTIFTANNTYTGGTTISRSTLQLGNGGTSGGIVGDVTDNGTLVFSRSDTVIFPGLISGTGSVNQVGAGITILTANNTYTGNTAISAGTLQLGNGGTSGGIVGDVTDNGTLVFNRSDTVTFPGLISGTGAVNQIGSGTTTLTGDNSYSGGTNVTNGTLNASSATALGTGAVVVNGQSSILNTQGTKITNSGTPNQSAVSILNGGTLSMRGGSINAVAGNALVVGGTGGGPNTVQINGAPISSHGSAIMALGTVDTNIVLSDVTNVNAGNGLLLEGKSSANTSLTANSSELTGNIQVKSGTANVTLNDSLLSGWINQSTLTGASGINPNDPQSSFANLPPANVNLSVDPSTWTMQASSTLNSLTLAADSQVIFTKPSSLTGPFKTLVVNNLLGTGGSFAMSTNISALKGDLVVINTKSQGSYSVSFNNEPQDLDGPANKGLLVVKTADGQAAFQGQADAGTFKERLVRGNGSAAIPDPNSWYLYREDQALPPGSPTSPVPQPPPVGRRAALTNTANAAIGTYSAAVPLYYADMQTLVQRMGDLRLSIQLPPAQINESAEQPGNGKGVVESKEVAPPPAPVTEQWDVWGRGFGSGTRIDNNVSRVFDQNAGGFQIGADRRFGSVWNGDLYLGVFGGYAYASRDFKDGGDGNTNEMSLGAYTSWIHPNGWYADLVVKYSQMWNSFRTPNLNGAISTADFDVPAFGGSLEVGKRIDLDRGLFFIEPQAQLAGVWIEGGSYTASNRLRVSGNDQTSLQGRLGTRLGMHIDLSEKHAIEPYLKAEVIQEFLTGNTVTTNNTPFDSHLSGTVGRFGAGVTTKLNRSIQLYCEYDYATGDHFEEPWSVSGGLRWQW